MLFLTGTLVATILVSALVTYLHLRWKPDASTGRHVLVASLAFPALAMAGAAGLTVWMLASAGPGDGAGLGWGMLGLAAALFYALGAAVAGVPAALVTLQLARRDRGGDRGGDRGRG